LKKGKDNAQVPVTMDRKLLPAKMTSILLFATSARALNLQKR
jgi:hypothetical protein